MSDERATTFMLVYTTRSAAAQHWDLVASVNGRSAIPLPTPGGQSVSSPDVSPNGTRVVYAAAPPDADASGGELWITTLASKEQSASRVKIDGTWDCPRWMRDGRHVIARAASGDSLAIVDTQSGELRAVELQFDGKELSCADPSPRQDKIVVAVATGDDELKEIWQVDLVKHQDRLIARLPNGAIANDPAWAPDGDTIATDVISSATEDNGIWTISLDGRITKVVGDNGPTTASDRAVQYWWPTWTPDGRHLIYWRFQPSMGPALHRFDLATKTERPLVGAYASYPSAGPTTAS